MIPYVVMVTEHDPRFASRRHFVTDETVVLTDETVVLKLRKLVRLVKHLQVDVLGLKRLQSTGYLCAQVIIIYVRDGQVQCRYSGTWCSAPMACCM